jgi:hypothetical protein
MAVVLGVGGMGIDTGGGQAGGRASKEGSLDASAPVRLPAGTLLR